MLFSDTFLIPFCNLRLQKGIRKVSERYQKGIRWWHTNTNLFHGNI